MTRMLMSVFLLLLMTSSAWGQSFPNQPSGSTVVSNFDYSTKSGGGWIARFSGCEIIADASAPASPSSVMRNTWRHEVISPLACIQDLTINTNRIYLGFYWKASNPFWGWTGAGGNATGNNFPKIMLLDPTRNHIYVGMERLASGDPTRYRPSIEWSNSPSGAVRLNPNVNAFTFTLGQWHLIEVDIKASTTPTSGDGYIKYWVNGTQTHNYTNRNFNQSNFTLLTQHHVWDAVDGCTVSGSPCRDQHFFDHVRVTVGGAGGPIPPPPVPPPPLPPPPTAPSGLRFGWLEPLKELWPWLALFG